jgi:UDP-glucose 4-epimerase
MDFIFVDDVARANLMSADSELSDEVLNIATGTETSLNDLAAALGKIMNVDIPPQYGPARKAVPVWRQLADVTKAERLLGFKAEVGLEEGLRRLVQWWTGQSGAPLPICKTGGEAAAC